MAGYGLKAQGHRGKVSDTSKSFVRRERGRWRRSADRSERALESAVRQGGRRAVAEGLAGAEAEKED